MATKNKMSPVGMVLIVVVVIGAVFLGWALATDDSTGDNRLTRAAEELTQDEEMSIEAGDVEMRVTD